MGEKVRLKFDPFAHCVYCKGGDKEQDIISSGIIEHMVVFKRQDGHIHVHGPIKNEPLIVEMIEAICSQVGIGVGFDDGDSEELKKTAKLSDKGSMNPEVEGSDNSEVNQEVVDKYIEGGDAGDDKNENL